MTSWSDGFRSCVAQAGLETKVCMIGLEWMGYGWLVSEIAEEDSTQTQMP